MISLDQAVALLRADGGAHIVDAPEPWAQGRTLYGGMTAAFAHEAALRQLGRTPPPLRSAQFTFVAPAAGTLAFTPAILRTGRSSAIVAVDCHAGDGLAARAAFTFAADRESAVGHDLLAAPAVPAPDECPPLHRATKPLPGFLARFDYRRAAGAALFSPGARPAFAAWVRFRDAAPADPARALLALTDALPCAAMVDFPARAPVSTMTWTIDLLHPAAADPDPAGWWLVDTVSAHARGGYSAQAMTVYDAAGRPLAVSRQVVAVFT